MQKVVDPIEVVADQAQQILARDIGWRVSKYEKMLSRHYNDVYEQLGFTFVETIILLTMSQAGHAKCPYAAEIAREYGIPRPVVCRALKKLVQRRLVIKAHADCGGPQPLSLTRNGFSAVCGITAHWDRFHVDIASLYGMYEVDALDRLLTKIEKLEKGP